MSSRPIDRRGKPPAPDERAPAAEKRRSRPLSPDDIRPSLHRPTFDPSPVERAEVRVATPQRADARTVPAERAELRVPPPQQTEARTLPAERAEVRVPSPQQTEARTLPAERAEVPVAPPGRAQVRVPPPQRAEARATTPERAAAKKPFRTIQKFVAIALLVVLAWTVWAAAALYDFASGLRNGDPVALERRIDWSSVRERLREDLQERPGPQAGSSSIDALVSQQAIANLLRTAKLDERGWDTAPPDSAQRQAKGRSQIQYAFFTGGPFAFRVDVKPDSDTIKEPLVLLFRWTGDWRLTRVFLPADAAANPSQASQTPPQAAVPAAAAAPEPQPAPPGAQRAMLYEEDPADPKGKVYSGSASWRTEDLPPVAGGASEFAVTTHANVPERGLNVTMAIRRNLDQTLPASHTIELKIDLPPNSPTGGIQDVPVIRMKPNEEAAGQQLSGSRVKVSDNFYLIGLSAIDVDVRHNIDLLTSQPWFGIPVIYNNRNRAVLVIEKGPAGEKSLVDALARWAKMPVGQGAGRKQ